MTSSDGDHVVVPIPAPGGHRLHLTAPQAASLGLAVGNRSVGVALQAAMVRATWDPIGLVLDVPGLQRIVGRRTAGIRISRSLEGLRCIPTRAGATTGFAVLDPLETYAHGVFVHPDAAAQSVAARAAGLRDRALTRGQDPRASWWGERCSPGSVVLHHSAVPRRELRHALRAAALEAHGRLCPVQVLTSDEGLVSRTWRMVTSDLHSDVLDSLVTGHPVHSPIEGTCGIVVLTDPFPTLRGRPRAALDDLISDAAVWTIGDRARPVDAHVPDSWRTRLEASADAATELPGLLRPHDAVDWVRQQIAAGQRIGLVYGSEDVQASPLPADVLARVRVVAHADDLRDVDIIVHARPSSACATLTPGIPTVILADPGDEGERTALTLLDARRAGAAVPDAWIDEAVAGCDRHVLRRRVARAGRGRRSAPATSRPRALPHPTPPAPVQDRITFDVRGGLERWADTAGPVAALPGGRVRLPGPTRWPLTSPSSDLDVTLRPGADVGDEDLDLSPGSPLLRMLVDRAAAPVVSVDVIDPPAVSDLPVIAHDPAITLLRRTWRRPRAAAAEVTFEVRSESGISLVTAQSGVVTTSGHPRVHLLGSGDLDHPGLPLRSAVRDAVRDAVRKAPRGVADASSLVRPVGLHVRGGEDMRIREVWRAPDGAEVAIISQLPTRGVPSHRDALGNPIRTLALCASHHPVDVDGLRRCDGCRGDRCASCPGGLRFTACRLCREESCHTCTSEGACAGCRQPVRTPIRDDGGRIAWEVRDAVLLVSGEGAELRRGDGTTLRLAEPEQADDAGWRRDRALAVRAGLPWDAPVVHRTPAPAAVGPEVLDRWLVSEHGSPLLAVRTDRGLWEHVDPGVLVRQPVRRTDDVGIPGLLTRLRAEDPPAATPPVEVIHHAHRVEVLLTAQGFRATDPEGTVRPVQLTPVHPVVHDARGTLVAVADHAGVVIELRAVNRLHLLTVRHLGLVRRWVLADDCGEDLPTATALHQVIRTLAPTSAAWVALPEDGWTATEDLREGEDVTDLVQVARHVTVAPYLVESTAASPVASAPVRAAGADHLTLLDRVPAPQASPPLPSLPRGVASALLDGIPAARPITIGISHTVVDRWVGPTGEVETTRVARDGCIPPVLGGATSAFTGDDGGHVIAADMDPCDGCGRRSCQRCPVTTRIARCRSCRSEVCGACDTARQAPDDDAISRDTCGQCERGPCGDCHQPVWLQACGDCGERVCRCCLDGGRCPPCAGGPEGLGSIRLKIFGVESPARAEGHRAVAWLTIGSCRYVICLHRWTIVRIIASGALPLTGLLLGARTGAATEVLLPRDSALRDVRTARPRTASGVVATTPVDEVVVDDVRCAVEPRATLDRRLADVVDPSALAGVEVLEGEVPDRAGQHSAVSVRTLDGWRIEVHTQVTANGVHRHTPDSRTSVPWEPAPDGALMDDGWQPTHRASTPEVDLTVLRAGSATRLRVRRGSHVTVLMGPHDESGRMAAAIAASTGVPIGPIARVDVLDLRAIDPTLVRSIRRRVVVTPAAPGRNRRDGLRPLLTAHDLVASTPPAGHAAGRLRGSLPPDDRTVVVVGEVATIVLGGAARTSVLHAATTHDTGATLIDGVAGAAVVDRDLHLVRDHQICASCRSLTCDRCIGAASPCEGCSIIICSGCASGSGHRCAACARLAVVPTALAGDLLELPRRDRRRVTAARFATDRTHAVIELQVRGRRQVHIRTEGAWHPVG